MDLIAVTHFVALLSTRLLAGVFFGDRMGASFCAPGSACFLFCAASTDSAYVFRQ